MKLRILVMSLCAIGTALLPLSGSAQEPCRDPQSIGCEYHPTYFWIKRGSAPPVAPDQSQRPTIQPDRERQRRVDEENLRQAREAEKREDAAKIANGPALAQRFQPVFDQVKVDDYRSFLDQFYVSIKPSQKIIVIGNGGPPSNDNLGEAYRSDPNFWGALFLRMGVASFESAEVRREPLTAESAMTYLEQARRLGFADADDLFDQMSSLGLTWLVPKNSFATFSERVKKWRELGAAGSRPPLKLTPPINLAERRATLEPYLVAARQRRAADEQRAAAAKRSAEEARVRLPLDPEWVRLIQRQDALISKALSRSARYASGFFSDKFDPTAPLPKESAAALVAEARKALLSMEQPYREQWGNRQSGPEDVLLNRLTQVNASKQCVAEAPTDCAGLLRLLDVQVSDWPRELGYAKMRLALVACHGERDRIACKMAGDNAGSRWRSNETEGAKSLGYLALACGGEKERVPYATSSCSDAAYCLLHGRCGPQDIDLAGEFYDLSCAHEAARDCNVRREQVQLARQRASR